MNLTTQLNPQDQPMSTLDAPRRAATSNRSSQAVPFLSFVFGMMTLIVGLGAAVFWLSYYLFFVGVFLGVVNVAAFIVVFFVGAAELEESQRGKGLAAAGIVMALIGLLANVGTFLWLMLR